MINLKKGVEVRLVVPDNLRLHGAIAIIASVTEWGAHVLTAAAATGHFRAAFEEMAALGSNGTQEHMSSYEGDPCTTCGSMMLRRNGSCLVCDNCGSTNGCS